MHGWQTRGCTKGRDFASKRIFRFDKIQSVKVTDGSFDEKSQSVKNLRIVKITPKIRIKCIKDSKF
jgi:hypothetical protein